jgi:phosphoserine phosphatase
MKRSTTKFLTVLFLFTSVAFAVDPLPSWNDGAAKNSILTFVEKVTTPGSPDFVPVPERVAVFDNDGTLWNEEPLPVQLFFLIDRVKVLAPQHPEWKTQEPYASLLKGDAKGVMASGEKGLMELIMATHTGMTTVEFEQIVNDWITTAKNPKTGKLFTEMTFQPMLEVLAYLRANGFKTYIVSGGGVEFMRAWSQQVYGIPPEQVVGSSIKTQFEMRDGKPVLMRLSQMNFNDNNGGKAVGINEHIGRRPIMAFGNSTGDKEMLQYTQGGSGARFELLVLHDDATRETAYGPARGLPNVPLVHFTPELDDYAKQNGWTVVSVKNDWKTIYASQPAVTAIDILLEPDATMLKHAAANNQQLLSVYPKGFALDAAHTPHITLIQTFVRTADLEQVYAAVEKVFVFANVKAMKLEAFKYYYAPAGPDGVAGICARPTPALLKLQADLVAAVAPYRVKTATVNAFTAPMDDPADNASFIQYISTFVPDRTGEHFNPHVSIGVAPKDYLDKMVAGPFEPFTFSPAGAAVFQLGPYGTAAKKLAEWNM